MNPGKKLTTIFNKAVTHYAYIAAAAVLSIGTGIGVSNHEVVTRTTTAPVQNVALHDAEVGHLRSLSDEILAAQYKIDFNGKSLEAAQANLGKSDAKLADQFAALQQATDQNLADKKAQAGRLAEFRKEVLFDPAVSEQEGDAIYEKLFDAAKDQQLNDIQNYFSPFSDALAHRDDVIAKMGLPHDPSRISDAAAEEAVARARAADGKMGTDEWLFGVEGGLGTLGSLLGLTALGIRGRRREEREEEAPAAAKSGPTGAPPEPPVPPPEPSFQNTAAAQKPAAANQKWSL